MREELRDRKRKRDRKPEYLQYKRYIYVVILLIVALLSFFPIAKMASDPARYAKTIAALDEKKKTVMELTAASTASSAAITLIPGLGVPVWLSYLLNLPYSVLAASLLVGQAVCGVVGALLLSALRRRFGILE